MQTFLNESLLSNYPSSVNTAILASISNMQIDYLERVLEIF
ncbi:hypothetical protein [Wolbachia endosymbiont of Howardula sp.]